MVRAASAGWLLFSIPHLIYHLGHMHDLDPVDRVGNIVTLVLAVALATAALPLSRPGSRRTRGGLLDRLRTPGVRRTISPTS